MIVGKIRTQFLSYRQGLISIKQGTGQMSWTLIKGTGQQPVITMFVKEEYQTLSCNMKNVPDILENYLANVRCPAWILAPAIGHFYLFYSFQI